MAKIVPSEVDCYLVAFLTYNFQNPFKSRPRNLPDGVSHCGAYETIMGDVYAIPIHRWEVAKGRIILGGTDNVIFDETPIRIVYSYSDYDRMVIISTEKFYDRASRLITRLAEKVSGVSYPTLEERGI